MHLADCGILSRYCSAFWVASSRIALKDRDEAMAGSCLALGIVVMVAEFLLIFFL